MCSCSVRIISLVIHVLYKKNFNNLVSSVFYGSFQVSNRYCSPSFGGCLFSSGDIIIYEILVSSLNLRVS
jgi:hypothetical protein